MPAAGCAFLGVLAFLLGCVSGAAEAGTVRARAIFPPNDAVLLERLDPVPLQCRRGAFRVTVPVNRLRAVDILQDGRLRLHFTGGGSCTGGPPARPLSGEWSHGFFKQAWKELKRLEILQPDADGPASGIRATLKDSGGAAFDGVALDPGSPLEVRRGAFRFRFPWKEVQTVKRTVPDGPLTVFLADGRRMSGLPPAALQGAWQGGVVSISGEKLAEAAVSRPGGEGEKPPLAAPPAPEAGGWGTVADDTGERVRLSGPPEFDGPFSLWDPVRQVRDRSLVPLVREEGTYLISAGQIREIQGEQTGRSGGRLEVKLASGAVYAGSPGDVRLRGESPEGRFEVPLDRVAELRPAQPPGKPPPAKGRRATVELRQGGRLELRDPLFFYERQLLPQWRESGISWTGGHTKPFLFVRLGRTVQRVSFDKLLRLETPETPEGRFVFVNREGGRLVLQVDWTHHTAFESMAGVEQVHQTAEAYRLAHRGLLGVLNSGVMVHVPWEAIRAVEFDGGADEPPASGSPRKARKPVSISP